jgi:hypothetical protein
VLEPTFGCEGTNLTNRDMKEQKHMIGRKKKQNMLEEAPREQKHMIGRKQRQNTIFEQHV